MALLAALIVTLVGCGSDSGDDGAVTESPDLGAMTEKMITAKNGGEVALDEAGVTLSIPAGALPDDTMITAEVISTKDLSGAKAIIGNAVEFGPDGQTFDKPVTLELEIDAKDIPKNADAVIAWYDEKAKDWVKLEGSAVEGGKVTAETTHFTIFAVRIYVREDGMVVQDDAGKCPADFDACGGDIKGTWTIVSGCANGDAVFSNVGMQCAGAEISFGVDITGDIVIGDGTIKGELTISTELSEKLPKTCTGGMCDEPDPEDEDAIVFEDKGDTCEGTQMKTKTEDIDETFTIDGSTIVTTDVESGEMETDETNFCVKGDTMQVNSVNEDGITIRWTAKRK